MVLLFFTFEVLGSIWLGVWLQKLWWTWCQKGKTTKGPATAAAARSNAAVVYRYLLWLLLELRHFTSYHAELLKTIWNVTWVIFWGVLMLNQEYKGLDQIFRYLFRKMSLTIQNYHPQLTLTYRMQVQGGFLVQKP